jgi:uncharacterized membrane protein
MIITPTIALIVFGIVVVIAIVMALLFSQAEYDTSSVRVFISVLAGLSIVITFLFYYSVVDMQQQERVLPLLAEQVRLSHHVHHDLSGALLASRESAPRLMNELLLGPASRTELDIAELLVSRQIFHSWQLVALASTSLDRLSYLTLFLQQATSQLLRLYWSSLRSNYVKRTQLLGDILFDLSNSITATTTIDEHETLAQRALLLLDGTAVRR